MIRTIVKLGDVNKSVLTTPCKKVIHVNRDIRNLIVDIWETMVAADGVGLAAPQVGISLRVAVIDIDRMCGKDKPGNLMALINPKLSVVPSYGSETGIEGCLSIPDRQFNVTRYRTIMFHAGTWVIEGKGSRGRALRRKYCYGFLARVIQHEVDHLDGLLVDRWGNEIVNP